MNPHFLSELLLFKTTYFLEEHVITFTQVLNEDRIIKNPKLLFILPLPSQCQSHSAPQGMLWAGELSVHWSNCVQTEQRPTPLLSASFCTEWKISLSFKYFRCSCSSQLENSLYICTQNDWHHRPVTQSRQNSMIHQPSMRKPGSVPR